MCDGVGTNEIVQIQLEGGGWNLERGVLNMGDKTQSIWFP